ncbi:hypothetical protein GCM10010347_63300 [Streptomyces cirratus]|uniref:Uncharacterized protein n=1 Tax=Streptomyces cirratus TaxID=68187 RepID=A0ABQ3F274_9ACTN|nr:hypothetical protein GCM10010347_63300 [Streptomyces cirratus]
MQVIDQVGNVPAQFFYAHEETAFAWRALDADWDIDHRAGLVLRHPRTPASRHAVYHRNTGRNRVWLAKRHLPAALVPMYLTSWAATHCSSAPRRLGCSPGGPDSSRCAARVSSTASQAMAHGVAHDPTGPTPGAPTLPWLSLVCGPDGQQGLRPRHGLGEGTQSSYRTLGAMPGIR